MFLFFKKTKPVPLDLSMAVGISRTGFYPDECPSTPNHQMICVWPDDSDENTFFGKFMRLCAVRLLSGFPFVIEEVDNGKNSLLSEPALSNFISSGGTVIVTKKDVLCAISGTDQPRLLESIPVRDLCRYGYNIYAYRKPLPSDNLLSPATDFQTSPFALRLFCHEWHDYFLIETPEDIQPYIDIVQTLCDEQDRQLIFDFSNADTTE